MWNNSHVRARRFCKWSHPCVWLCIPVLGVANLAAAQTDSDDWPVRLTFGEESSEHARTLTAENLATFNCTKLRLQISIDSGTLTRGGGHTSARLVDGELIYDEVPVLKPGEKIEWTLHFEQADKNVKTRITARLDYAEKPTPKPTSPPAPAPAPRPKTGCTSYAPPVGRDMSVTELVLPTGNRSTGALLIHKVVPVEVEKGKQFTYQYHVTNLQDCKMQGVELLATDFLNLNLVKSEPSAETAPDGYRWRLGDLDECQTKIINVQATSANVGSASACLSAVYSNKLCALTRVVEPALKLVATATPDHLLCDEADFVLTVSNPGSGFARNVKVTDELPAGLITNDGKRKIEADAGDLGPGQSKQLAFKVKASKIGDYTNQAAARADGGLTAQSNSTTTVFRLPVLQVACSAPEQRYIGRTADFCFDVKNAGNAISTDTVLTASIPVGAEITDVGAKGAKQDKGITWQLGALKPNETQHVCFKAKATTATTMKANGRVAGRCADPVEDPCETRVVGIPGILLEVVDVDDPIEVGSVTTYVITVTNQGTAPDTNIRVAVTIPDEAEYVSATGATVGRAEGQKVTFAPAIKLDAKQKAEWKLNVKAKKPGNVRLAVEMTSDQFTTPIRETEATNLYE